MEDQIDPDNIPLTEDVRAKMLPDGRTVYTTSMAAAVRYKAKLSVIQIEHTDDDEMSWVVQFHLFDPEFKKEE